MTQASREYAAALFTLGKETGTEEEIYSSLDLIEGVFRENPVYVDFLASPGIPVGERIEKVQELLAGRVHEYAESFICVLCEKGRIREVLTYIEEYKSLYNLAAKVLKAQVTTAVNLSESEKLRLREKIEKRCGHAVEMEFSIDKSLIGGVLVNVDGHIFDGTVKQYLSEIKEVMSK